MTQVKTAKDIVPEIPLVENPQEAETRLYENFKVLHDVLTPGASGSFTAGGHTLTIVNGIITQIT